MATARRRRDFASRHLCRQNPCPPPSRALQWIRGSHGHFRTLPAAAAAAASEVAAPTAMGMGAVTGMFSRRWVLVALANFEILTATGIMFGFSSLALALRRDGVYNELCDGTEAGPPPPHGDPYHRV